MTEERANYATRSGEIHEAFDDLMDELDATMTALGRIMSARHGEMCNETGLTIAQLVALRVLGEVGSARIGDLATHVGIKPPAASALIDSLDAKGYIAREPDAEDRRVTRVSLTDAGHQQLMSAEAERREHMRRYFSVLEEDDLRVLVRINRTLIDAMIANRV